MEHGLKEEPRVFKVGEFECRDWGSLTLSPPDEKTNDMVTLETGRGRRCDVTGTSWGLYLGPSLNGRLKDEGFRAALIANPQGRVYLVAVESDRMEAFQRYLAANGSKVVQWLDGWTDSPQP